MSTSGLKKKTVTYNLAMCLFQFCSIAIHFKSNCDFVPPYLGHPKHDNDLHKESLWEQWPDLVDGNGEFLKRQG